MENIQQQIVSLDGGLVLNKDPFTQPPGSALQLQNFEPSIKGGYRRINGTNKYALLEFNDTTLGTSSKTGTEAVLLSSILGYDVIAARGAVVGKATSTFFTTSHTDAITTLNVNNTGGFATSGTLYAGSETITYTGKTATTFTGATRGASSSTEAAYLVDDIISTGWTKIDEARTSANPYTFTKYNFSGSDKIAIADGQNYAASYDGTTYTLLNGSVGSGSGTAPTATESIFAFRNHMFFAKSSSEELVFSAPFAENDFTPANGAGSIRVNDKIVGLMVFREKLFIFCRNSIYVLSGSSVTDFVVEPVTRDIGCLDKFSIQEVGGDLIYLAPDGLRTIAGTDKIDDVELGTISKAIQERVEEIGFDNLTSVVVREKSQYRLFFPKTAGNENNQSGILGTMKQDNQGQVGFQWADIVGLKPSSTDSEYIGQIEVILHGAYDGFVYQQENGNTFAGTSMEALYRSADLIMGDAGIRKSMQRVITNYRSEGTVNARLLLRYDYDSSSTPQPAAYAFNEGAATAIYGVSKSTYGLAVYGEGGNPLTRQSVEGSGFAVAIKMNEDAGSYPFVLNGFQLEFTAGGRH
tara:strand:+ start:276 stop:2018 length:1743 start_codon:yes stop_codon:yes gene_type:complete